MEIGDKERRIEAPEETPVLPQEIMLEILSRLPVKTLCQFRCVCKLWLSLISDRQFAKAHLKHALLNEDVYSQRQRLMISSHNLYSVEYESIDVDSDGMVALELDYPLKDKPNGWAELLGSARDGLLYCERDGDDEQPVMVKLNFPCSVNPRNWVDIIGSCNGLVCIAPDEEALFLFNPSIRESKKIPEPPSESAPNGLSVYGFGFDSVNDDYKLVKLGCKTVSLYSLRTDSWREIGIVPYEDIGYESGTLLSGAMHWVATCGADEDCVCVIAAFDFAKESFVNLPAPDTPGRKFEFVTGVLNGCLCVLHSYNQMHDEFWVMTEYGVAQSWTRLNINISYICMKPLCLAKNGEVVLEIDGKLMLYNLEDDSFRDLVVHGIPVGEGFEADTYLETLISPNGYFEGEM